MKTTIKEAKAERDRTTPTVDLPAEVEQKLKQQADGSWERWANETGYMKKDCEAWMLTEFLWDHSAGNHARPGKELACGCPASGCVHRMFEIGEVESMGEAG